MVEKRNVEITLSIALLWRELTPNAIKIVRTFYLSGKECRFPDRFGLI